MLRRVLGLLPGAVAADAVVHEGLARALPGAERDRRARRRLRAVGRPRRGRRRRSSGSTIPYPVAIDAEYELWQEYGNLGWPARYLFDQRGMLLHYHYGEGGYEETERAIQELLGVERPAGRAVPPRRGARRRCSRRRPTTSRGPTRGRTRPAASGRCSTAPATVTVQRPDDRRRSPGLLRADLPRAEHRRRAGPRARRGRALPRGVLHTRSGFRVPTILTPTAGSSPAAISDSSGPRRSGPSSQR